MTKYLMPFQSRATNVPDREFQAVADAAHAVVREAKDAGVWVSGDGVDESVPPVRVDSDGTLTDGRTRRRRGSRAATRWLELPIYGAALEWAAKIATARRCAQVRAFQG